MTRCKCGHDAKVHVDGNGPCCEFSRAREFGGRFFCRCRKFQSAAAEADPTAKDWLLPEILRLRKALDEERARSRRTEEYAAGLWAQVLEMRDQADEG